MDHPKHKSISNYLPWGKILGSWAELSRTKTLNYNLSKMIRIIKIHPKK